MQIPLVNITRPFEKVAIDIVGPLPMTRKKNRYILTYIDLGSRYPDAVPLPITTAKVVAEQLLNIMSRLSVPLEILSDRGSNFLSSVMKEAFSFLGIRHSKTAPYRPQSNGAVERFHHTLLQMIRKTVQDHKDWDVYLPYFLFACREAPCSSTGFSPFELIFGKHVHGPLDILSRQWVPARTTSPTVTDWLIELRNDLSEMRDVATDHYAQTQTRTKEWFDKKTQTRQFEKGDRVLVFTPAFTGHKGDKLDDRWCGPYTILGRLSPVTYSVDMPERHKKTRSVHVTALKRWQPPISNISYISADTEDNTNLPDYHPQPTDDQPQFGPQLSSTQQREITDVFSAYPRVTTSTLGRATSAKHRIDTGDALPIRLHPYRVPKVWEEPFRKEIHLLQANGLIEPSTAPWAAPMFAIPKKTPGSVRLVVDYRRLNTVTVPDPYYLPRIEDTLERMARAQFFSTFDLARGFYQVPLLESDRDKTTFLTPFGKFRFTVMPFGLRNAPATFQRLMDGILGGHSEFCNVYIDDISVFSETWDDHLRHLHVVFKCLQQEGLTIQTAKTQLGMKNCHFLGHVVGEGCITPQQAKTIAVDQFRQPKSKTDVRAFLGLVGYYRKFIPDFSTISAPLTDLTKKLAPDPVLWTTECSKAFKKLKQLLCSQPVLHAPDYKLPFVLQTDASSRGIGAILTQTTLDGMEHPIAYYSRKMFPREQRYSATEQEGLAVVEACKHFLPYLLGRPFQIMTDHRALTFLEQKETSNGRLARWMDILRQFQFTITYRPGVINQNADALSRQAWTQEDPIPAQTSPEEREMLGTT